MDFYLEDRTRLNGQPKKTIGDYVESNGVLVPRRYASFEEAKNHGLVLARSEHPQDYDGCSGILESLLLNQDNFNSEEEIRQRVLYPPTSSNNVNAYLKLSQQDPEKFKGECSFSYWQKIPGDNVMVVADSAVPERYHLTFKKVFKKRGLIYRVDRAYFIVEREEIIKSYLDTEGSERSFKQVSSLIQDYEKIRKMDHFDPLHCPLMEFQSAYGKNFFLQYHRTRDFEPADFVLDRGLKKGEVEAFMVRGKTPREGMKNVPINVYRPKSQGDWLVPEHEEGAWDGLGWIPFEELAVRKRKVQISNGKNHPEDMPINPLSLFTLDHTSRSQMFKPEISLTVPLWKIYPDEDNKIDIGRKTGEDQYIYLDIISDGRKAYVKRVG